MTERLGFLIPSLAGGGAERVVSLLSQELERDHAVDLLLLEDSVGYPHGGTVRKLDIDTGAPGFATRMRAVRDGIRAVNQYRRDDRPLALVSFMFWSNVMNLMSEGPGATIISVRTTLSVALRGGGSRPLYRGVVRAMYPHADLIVTLSRHVADDLRDNFGVPQHKLLPIYNPVDAAYVRDLSSELVDARIGAWFDRPVIATVGRLIKDKGHAHLLRAFTLARKQGCAARLLIVGDGVERANLLTQCAELGLEASFGAEPYDADVWFTGFTANPFALLRRATLFALPSLREGFGNVILEAMACEVPILAAGLAGPREIIAPDTDYKIATNGREHAEFGILLPPFPGVSAERVWADAFCEVCAAPQAVASLVAAGNRRLEDFALDAITAQWLDAIDSTTGT